MVALVFPGQGSQRKGMGADLFARFPDLTRQADTVLGHSVEELCRSSGDGRLDRTEYAQPALFVVSALSYLARDPGLPQPTLLAGHSLGEYGALFAAGCFDFATGVRLVRERGALMGRAQGGGMLAVLGVDGDEVQALLAGTGARQVDVANYNTPTQTVLSGPLEELRMVSAALGQRPGVRCVPVRVSAAFHSRHMRPAAQEFATFLTGFSFADPHRTVISSVTARPYGAGQVAELLSRQIESPVRWSETMAYLRERGTTELEEMGPGKVLTGLWKQGRADGAKARAVVPAPVAVAAGVPAAAAARTPVSSAPVAARAATAAPARPSDPAPPAPRTAPSPAAPVPPASVSRGQRAEELGSAEFRRDYGIRYAYLAGAMFRGIASAELVIRMGRAGLMGFFGAGGLGLDKVESALVRIKDALGPDGRYGMNLLHSIDDPAYEHAIVDLCLKHGVHDVEAAGFTQLTPAVVQFRFSGAHRDAAGRPVAVRRVLAKVSRPEVAAAFMAPAPAAILRRLTADGRLTPQEAEIAAELPVGQDICVEADSGGHTDGGAALTLLPSMIRHRDAAMARHGYGRRIRIGAAGGIGAPEAVAAAFVLGADFVLTGSVNQCSPEAGTSDAVKDILAGLDVQDTAYAPAGDMFEIGARVQVVRKGTLFAARGNKLYQLYRSHDSWESIDAGTRRSVEETYFKRPFAEVWEETRAYHLGRGRDAEIEKADRLPKHRMALAFRWYFARSVRWGLEGEPTQKVNYQIQCGPAIGAFNYVVRGTGLEDWRHRHVDLIAEHLMTGAADVLARR
ncbi:ACP S-malonyltransferase [Streptomyces sp. NBC_01445]|uniref:ACP S-malonyltransferase n=1 Tax=Streptomyces sp. NBC_01445 TaxID=2903869 RepID=UPI002DDC41D7|nr:ACP S-malonyltransferase [Streptomyces sp. NBC_01445]WSE11694.1 ACP S-malonyltransferase [Streptomyces sp. NBC_01445]